MYAGVCFRGGGVVCLVQGGVSGPGGRVVCLVRGGVSGLGGGVPGPGGKGGCVSQNAMRQTPLPPVDRQTPVKILPWPNFVAAGKNVSCNHYTVDSDTAP